MKHWFIPIAATLLSALAFTVAIAVTLVADSRAERAFGLGEEAAIVHVSPDMSRDPSLTVLDVQHWLTNHDFGLVIDGLGDGVPGLTVIDPLHAVSWLPRDTARETVHEKHAGSVFIFQGTYCHKEWQAAQRCALVPAGSVIEGEAPAPAGVKSQQYAYLPPPDDALNPGFYILSGGSEAELQSFKALVENGGFSTAAPVRPRYLQDLVMNPFVEISLALATLAAVLVATSLVSTFRRDRAEFMVRLQSGAHRSKLISETVLKTLPHVALGSIIGASSMPVATSLLAGVTLSLRETASVSIVAAGASTVTICALVALAGGIVIPNQRSSRVP